MLCDQTAMWTQIIGPAPALSGVIIGLLYSAREKEKEREHQRKILLRSKYEELALALSESVSHVQELLTVGTTLELFSLARPALAQKIDILARLYFPELKNLSDNYLLAIISLQDSLAEGYDSSLPLKVWEQGTKSEKVEKAKDNLLAAKCAFDEAIDRYAEKYA